KDAKDSNDAKPAKRWPLVVAILLVNLLTVGGVVAYFALFHTAGASAAAAAPPPAPAATEYGPLHPLAPIVANLPDRSAGRFVRVTVHLEAKDDEALATVVAREIPIRHRLLIYFSELDPTRAAAPGGKDVLREELVPAVNEVIGSELVRRVYFSEFVVQ
nr:flagellar basal body-associated FliL family protein [Myxococcota bacterium]